MALSAKQQRFIEEYLVDLNATAAAERAGYKDPNIGRQLITKNNVAAAIQEGMAARSQRTEITVDKVLERFHAIATANPNELIEYRRVCCRWCHGDEHHYQYKPSEMERRRIAWEAACVKAALKGKESPTFDPEGGSGYDTRKAPHPECPECFGEGTGEAFAKDTRSVSPAALCLYAGVKVTKDGLEIKMHDQAAALANVAKHLGMFKDIVEHKGDPDNPVKHDVTLTISQRIDALSAAFEGAADRAGQSGPAGDCPGQPVDS